MSTYRPRKTKQHTREFKKPSGNTTDYILMGMVRDLGRPINLKQLDQAHRRAAVRVAEMWNEELP